MSEAGSSNSEQELLVKLALDRARGLSTTNEAVDSAEAWGRVVVVVGVQQLVDVVWRCGKQR